MERVPPIVRLKAEITSTLQTGESVVGSTEQPMVGFVGRLARYMLQVAIEAEATAFLGREHCRRDATGRLAQRLRGQARSGGSRPSGARDAAVARDGGAISAADCAFQAS
jgi:hypothetical protein